MIGKPDWLGVLMPSSWSRSSTRAVRRWSCDRSWSPRSSLTRRPSSTVASEATGDGPEYRYGGAAVLSTCLSGVGQAMKASSDE